MYYAMLVLSGLTCLLLVAAIFMILRMDTTAGQQYMLGYVACAAVQNFAYLFELTATTPEAALMTLRMRYLGSTYIAIFLCEFTYFTLKKQQEKKFFQILAGVATLLLSTMWFAPGFHFFYHRLEWVEQSVHSYFKVYYGVGFYLWALCSCVLPCVFTVYLLIGYLRSGHSAFGRERLTILTAIASLLPIIRILYVFNHAMEYDFYPVIIGIALATTSILFFRSSTNDLGQLSVGKMTDRLAEIVLIVDDLGNIIDCNQSARKMLGDGILGRSLGDKFESVRRLDEKELNCSYEIGGKFYEGRVEGINAKNGRVIGYLIMLYETTVLHETMKQLQVLKERAEDANIAKSTFLSNMSHEIRTPMNTIVGITEILQGRIHDMEEREYLASIRASGESLLSIINDILDFSKIENGDVELQNAEYEIMSILQDLGMMFLNQIREKPIELLFDVDKNLPEKLVGDSVRVRQVIINILSNAVKYTEEGYIKLQIRYVPLTEETCELAISVTDTGIGIREEDIGKVFENFTRVDMEHNNAKEGTGLGLAIAKNIVERMGGQIRVNSVYGMGTRFSFSVVQRMAESKELAVNLESEKGRNVSAFLHSNQMLSILKELVGLYEMNYISFGESGHIDYFFMDEFTARELGSQIERMHDEGTRVILLQNPMAYHSKLPCDAICNKPLYSLSFANALHGIGEVPENAFTQVQSFIAPGARILIVDDNEMNLKVAKGLLEPLQMTINTAENGEAAIRRIDGEAEYDLILMDHMMPVMDGIEATRILRSREEEYPRKVPIIALTANVIVGVKETFLAAGMDDMVAKPIDLQVLYRKIRTYLPKELIIDMGTTMQLPTGSMESAQGFSAKPKAVETEVSKPSAQTEQKTADDGIPVIPGVNVKKGIAYCQNFEFLCEMFHDFCAAIDKKTALITSLLEAEDYKNYTVEVHGLKGTSRMIGATELGEEFYELEKLGKAQDLDAMKRRTPEVLEHYRTMGENLAPYAN